MYIYEIRRIAVTDLITTDGHLNHVNRYSRFCDSKAGSTLLLGRQIFDILLSVKIPFAITSLCIILCKFKDVCQAADTQIVMVPCHLN